jgi:riboflavin synthase
MRLAHLVALLAPPTAGGWSLAAGLTWHASRREGLRHRSTAPRAMFSGIVEEIGSVARLEKRTDLPLWDGTVGEGWELEVKAEDVLSTAELGCSIAVNGVCLTVTAFDDSACSFGLAPETLRLTNLADLQPGAEVNLERALAADGRNSGHMVQGHVDDVGTIEELRPEGDALWVRVRPPARLMPYIVPKGFIAIDGTSLTVCEVNTTEGWFNFMLVAYTQQHIIIPKKPLGGKVNIEVDVTAKYVEKSMSALLGRVEALEEQVAALAAAKQ